MTNSWAPRWQQRHCGLKLPKSTMAEAERALQQSKDETTQARHMRVRVDQVAEEAARQLEANHLSELFRPAFRGDGV